MKGAWTVMPFVGYPCTESRLTFPLSTELPAFATSYILRGACVRCTLTPVEVATIREGMHKKERRSLEEDCTPGANETNPHPQPPLIKAVNPQQAAKQGVPQRPRQSCVAMSNPSRYYVVPLP